MGRTTKDNGARAGCYSVEEWDSETMREALLETNKYVRDLYLTKIARDGIILRELFFNEKELDSNNFYKNRSTVLDYIWFMEEESDRHGAVAERLKDYAYELIAKGKDVLSQNNLLEKMLAEKTASLNCLHETLYIEKMARDRSLFNSPVTMVRDFLT